MLDFYIILCGSACIFEDAVLNAAQSLCAGKLKHAQLVSAGCEYAREWTDRGAETIAQCDTLTVHFMSPTEIRSGGSAVAEIDFALFIDSLFGRISGIIDNYTDSEFILPYRLVERKPFVQADYDLRRVRFSTGGQPIDGVIGKVRYFGDITRYLPYIDLGTQLHIGKKTTRGCGEYYFEKTDSIG